MTEIIMTLQAPSLVVFAPPREVRSPSLWRRLFTAIMEGRQRKADAYIADYLERHRGEYHTSCAPRSSDAVRIDKGTPVADVSPLALERAGEPPWRQGVARSVQERRDARESISPQLGQPPISLTTVERSSSWRALGSHSTSSLSSTSLWLPATENRNLNPPRGKHR